MEEQAIEVTPFEAATGDFTVWGMFWQADWVVQLVIISLLVASVWSWIIIIGKFRHIKAIKKKADGFEETFWSGNSLEDVMEKIGASPDNPLAVVFMAAMGEWKKSVGSQTAIKNAFGIQERINMVMNVTINREMEKIERHSSYLASVGSVSPFVGLFGTVWGIMNSFTSIAETANTSLAVVAPGIAEALLATALGLMAAIPAVVFYNRLTNEMNRYAARMEGFADEFGAYLSRQLEERS
ncbi:MAG: protein TolQ [Sphingomonadales bacterium]